MDESIAPVFTLSKLAKLYDSRMEQLGFPEHVHTTRLKRHLLAYFPDMQAHTKGRDVLLVFDKDIGVALTKTCEEDSDSDAAL